MRENHVENLKVQLKMSQKVNFSVRTVKPKTQLVN
jgi:hypothetical protein